MPYKSTRSLATLLLGTALLVLGQGLLLAVVPLSMNARGFSAQEASLAGAAYFAGFMAGAWQGEHIIRSVGHIRSYGGLIALVIVAVLLLPFFPTPAGWTTLRLLHGFAAGGVFLAVEAWLNGVTEGPWRGRVLGIYMVITLGALGIAPVLANFNDITGAAPFMIGGILFAASIVPVMLTRIDVPEIEAGIRTPLIDTYRQSPFSFVTSLAAGMSIGAFWTLAPYFAASLGMSVKGVSALIATTVFSGLFLQWPVGYLSGRHDRRHIVFIVTGAAAVSAALALVLMDLAGWTMIYAAFAVLGGHFCLYPLSMAHAIDHASGRNAALEMSRGLLLTNGLGLTLGPLIAGPFLVLLGPKGLIIYFVVILAGLAAFTARRLRVGVASAPELQGEHVFVRTITPAGAHLDPRIED